MNNEILAKENAVDSTASITPEPRQKPLILIVEDNLTQQKLFRLISPALGIDIHIASTANEAIKAASYLCFDVILMDLQLPVQDGFECTKRIRQIDEERGRHTPIIAVTAHVVLGNEKLCKEQGMDDFLAKPFTLDEISDKLRKWTHPSEH